MVPYRPGGQHQGQVAGISSGRRVRLVRGCRSGVHLDRGLGVEGQHPAGIGSQRHHEVGIRRGRGPVPVGRFPRRVHPVGQRRGERLGVGVGVAGRIVHDPVPALCEIVSADAVTRTRATSMSPRTGAVPDTPAPASSTRCRRWRSTPAWWCARCSRSGSGGAGWPLRRRPGGVAAVRGILGVRRAPGPGAARHDVIGGRISRGGRAAAWAAGCAVVAARAPLMVTVALVPPAASLKAGRIAPPSMVRVVARTLFAAARRLAVGDTAVAGGAGVDAVRVEGEVGRLGGRRAVAVVP